MIRTFAAASLLVLVGLHFFTASVSADTLTWNNYTSGMWNVSSNWSPARVPTINDKVVSTQGWIYTGAELAQCQALELGNTALAELSLGGRLLCNQAGDPSVTTVGSFGTLNIYDGASFETTTSTTSIAGRVNVMGAGAVFKVSQSPFAIAGGTVNLSDGGRLLTPQSSVSGWTGTLNVNNGGAWVHTHDGTSATEFDLGGTVNIYSGGQVKITKTTAAGMSMPRISGEVNVTGGGANFAYNGGAYPLYLDGAINVSSRGNANIQSPVLLNTAVSRLSITGQGSVSTNGLTLQNGELLIRDGSLKSTYFSTDSAGAFNIYGSGSDIQFTSFQHTGGRVTFYPGVHGTSTIKVSAEYTNRGGGPMYLDAPSAFMSLGVNTMDLISYGKQPMNEPYANNLTLYTIGQTMTYVNDMATLRLMVQRPEEFWDLEDTFRFEGGGQVSGTMMVEGRYTYLEAIFDGIDSPQTARLLADYLNQGQETSGLYFSLCNANSLMLTGGYLGTAGYGYFAWDLNGFNDSHNTSISLLGFNEIPEPSTWVLLLLGVVAMAGYGRASRKRQTHR